MEGAVDAVKQIVLFHVAIQKENDRVELVAAVGRRAQRVNRSQTTEMIIMIIKK